MHSCMKNRTMKPVEIVLRRDVRGIRENNERD
jgi:hypothetical protein